METYFKVMDKCSLLRLRQWASVSVVSLTPPKICIYIHAYARPDCSHTFTYTPKYPDSKKAYLYRIFNHTRVRIAVAIRTLVWLNIRISAKYWCLKYHRIKGIMTMENSVTFGGIIFLARIWILQLMCIHINTKINAKMYSCTVQCPDILFGPNL